MARIFAYIEHRGGVADDTAAELLAAAKKIDAAQSPAAIVTGSGPALDAVCESLKNSYAEIWKIANDALAYPNAELVRKALVAVVARGSVVLVPHAHFGVDLSPGLSFKLDAAYVPDVLDIEGVREGLGGTGRAKVRAVSADGGEKSFQVQLRVDTPQEVEYYRNGGILPYVLRQLAGQSVTA